MESVFCCKLIVPILLDSSVLYPFCTLFASITLFISGSLFFFRKNNSKANILLAFIVFIPAATFLVNYFMYSGFICQYPSVLFINFNTVWVLCLTWYVKLLLGQDIKLDIKKIPHLIPFVLNTAYCVALLLENAGERNRILNDIHQGVFPWQMVALDVVIMFQILGYLVYCALEIKKYKKENKESIANRIPIAKVSWLTELVYLLIALNILLIVIGAVVPYDEFTYVYVPAIFLVFYYTIIYEAFRNSAIFSANEFAKYISDEKENKQSYSSSTVNESHLEDTYTKVLSYIQQERPYRQQEISLKELSENMEVSLHLLSQAINQKFGKSFPDLMNYYRVEDAKKMLNDHRTLNLSIEGIGLECGFNSSSTFYRAFKKHTGITPSQYIKKMSDKE